MIEGLLPIGSVVLLKDSTKRLMIMGVAQRSADEPEKLWDYAGCFYPEGYFGADKVFLFNNDQIVQIFALGYQDAEQIEFKKMADQKLSELRNKEA